MSITDRIPSAIGRMRTEFTRIISDYDARKKFPNSIRALIRTIRKEWDNKSLEERPVKDFVPIFWPTYRDISRRYKGNKVPGANKPDNEVHNIKGIIDRLEFGTKDISFFQIRAFAHYVKLPTGLFLLYCQALGDATRNRTSNTDVLDLIDSSIAGLKRLREVVGEHPRLNNVMYESVKETEVDLEYKALLPPLREMVEAYNSDRHPPPGSS